LLVLEDLIADHRKMMQESLQRWSSVYSNDIGVVFITRRQFHNL
jgi:hypothetical protein